MPRARAAALLAHGGMRRAAAPRAAPRHPARTHLAASTRTQPAASVLRSPSTQGWGFGVGQVLAAPTERWHPARRRARGRAPHAGSRGLRVPAPAACWMSPLSPARSPRCQPAPPARSLGHPCDPKPYPERDTGVASLPASQGGCGGWPGAVPPLPALGKAAGRQVAMCPSWGGDTALGTLGCPWGQGWGHRPHKWVRGAAG